MFLDVAKYVISDFSLTFIQYHRSPRKQNKKNPLDSALTISPTRGLEKEVLDLLLIAYFLAIELLVREAIFFDQSGLGGKAEATLGIFSGKKINIMDLRLR